MAKKSTGKKASNTKKSASSARSAVAAAPKNRMATKPVKKSKFNDSIKKPMKKPASGTPAKAPTANGTVPHAEKAAKAVVSKEPTKSDGGKNAKSLKKTRTVAEAASTVTADSKGYVFINGRRVRMITIKPNALKKPRTSASQAAAAEEKDTPPIKSLKTKLSKPELNHYRDILLTKRRDLAGDLSAMENEALRSGGGNLSHMPIHMADIGTDTFDQDFMLGLAATERNQLREIDEALQRIEDKTYGVCQMTGKPIPKARLDAKPWAKYTIEAARLMEQQNGH